MRRMRDENFRTDQLKKCDEEPEQQEVTAFVRGLKKKQGGIPFVAPTYGGSKARILVLLSDPGKMAQEGPISKNPTATKAKRSGSGFISHENDDQTAENLARCLNDAGLLNQDGSKAPLVMAWNAYPWPLPDDGRDPFEPNDAELKIGLRALKRFVSPSILPELRCIICMGGPACKIWGMFMQQPDEYRKMKGMWVSYVYHPSPNAIRSDESRMNQIRDALKTAKRISLDSFSCKP